MAIEVITKFLDSATVLIWAYIKKNERDSNDLVDPTAVTIDIYDPDGTQQVDGSAMTKEDTGEYYYYYHKGASEDPMDKGKWRGVVTSADGTGDDTVYSTGTFGFEVE